ncbi:MAG: hypothetical protein PF485_05740 [Bacteroidales bacterium]|jgi:hypothetical protein|nr:hypothetical protein [Bacteroidales bacterium]
MKKILVFVCLVFVSLSSFSQKLNKLGKIEIVEIPTIPDYRFEKINGNFKVNTDSFVFDGNSFYKIPTGFITSLEIVDTQKDYIKHYDSRGKLIATILSDRIINLKISEKGNKLAFYNSKNIIQINLGNYKVDTLQGSFIYSFVGNEDLMYYNSDNKFINYKGNQISIYEFPNQFIDYKGGIYIITKYKIYKLQGNSLFIKYEFKGKFFDAKIIDKEFYFVDMTEKRKSKSFSLYKTSDFSKFILVDRKDDLNR